MRRDDRFTWGARPVRLTFPAPGGVSQAVAGGDRRGAEYLWGALTDELRAAMLAGGCPRRAFEDAVLGFAAWAPPADDLRLYADQGTLYLAGERPDGATVTVGLASAPACFLVFTWDHADHRLTIPRSSAPDFWAQLPASARAALLDDGRDKAGENAALREELELAQAAGEALPTLYLAMPRARARG